MVFCTEKLFGNSKHIKNPRDDNQLIIVFARFSKLTIPRSNFYLTNIYFITVLFKYIIKHIFSTAILENQSIFISKPFPENEKIEYF